MARQFVPVPEDVIPKSDPLKVSEESQQNNTQEGLDTSEATENADTDDDVEQKSAVENTNSTTVVEEKPDVDALGVDDCCKTWQKCENIIHGKFTLI